MTAQANRSRPISPRLPVDALVWCALLVLVAFACIPSRAQSTPPQQAPPTQPATQQPAPAQPAPAAQSNTAESQKNADSDDDKWPDPEWETQQKQAAAQAAPAPQAQTPAPAPPAQNQPAPVAQSSPAPAQTDTTTAQPAAQPSPAASPTPPRPLYTGTNPEELRKQQVALECSQLLQLATDLKAQVEKARKDELSVGVVRKATELEQMARKVRSGTPLSASNEQPPKPEGK